MHRYHFLQNWSIPISNMYLEKRKGPSRAVVLESGLKTFFYRLGLVLDLLVVDSDLSRTWSLNKPNVLVGLDQV